MAPSPHQNSVGETTTTTTATSTTTTTTPSLGGYLIFVMYNSNLRSNLAEGAIGQSCKVQPNKDREPHTMNMIRPAKLDEFVGISASPFKQIIYMIVASENLKE
jgi:hypothetical protein